MRQFILAVSLISLLTVSRAQADAVISSVQQTLKDQGFYYGEITGRKDADTTAAIRRYQIRNGLQITGELSAETQKSLGIKGAVSAPAPTVAPSRAATPPPVRAPILNETREAPPQRTEPIPRDTYNGPSLPEDYAPGPRGLAPETSGIFDGTPYEVAPPQLQQRVVVGAQSLLARRGYYRSAIDGVYGPGMAFAVRAFQSRFAITPSGRLDMETLAALGLLPGQQAPGVTAPRGRSVRRPGGLVAPNGERMYIPR